MDSFLNSFSSHDDFPPSLPEFDNVADINLEEILLELKEEQEDLSLMGVPVDVGMELELEELELGGILEGLVEEQQVVPMMVVELGFEAEQLAQIDVDHFEHHFGGLFSELKHASDDEALLDDAISNPAQSQPDPSSSSSDEEMLDLTESPVLLMIDDMFPVFRMNSGRPIQEPPRPRLPHTCLTCGVNLSSAGVLNRHYLIHGGPFKCSICSATFKNKTSLTKHGKVHDYHAPA